MDCLLSPRSAVKSHEEGFHLQSHNLISCGRPLCTPSHNHNLACCLQAKDNLPPSLPPGTSQSSLFLTLSPSPGLDPVPRPWAPDSVLCSSKTLRGVWMSKSLRTLQPQLCCRPGDLQTSSDFPMCQTALSHLWSGASVLSYSSVPALEVPWDK